MIHAELNVECSLVSGGIGEFSIYWNGEKVIAKGDRDLPLEFPSFGDVLFRLKDLVHNS